MRTVPFSRTFEVSYLAAADSAQCFASASWPGLPLASLWQRAWPQATAVCDISGKFNIRLRCAVKANCTSSSSFCRALACSFRLSSSCRGDITFRTCPKMETEEHRRLRAGREVRGYTKLTGCPKLRSSRKNSFRLRNRPGFDITRSQDHVQQITRLAATVNAGWVIARVGMLNASVERAISNTKAVWKCKMQDTSLCNSKAFLTVAPQI